jgi:hypothetical protein
MTQDHEFSAVRKPSDAFVRQQQVLLRIGAGCAIAGPLVLAASFAPHGDLPTDVSTEAALRFVADHSAWLVVHLLTIVAALIWLGAFTALAHTLSPGVAGAIGRMLAPVAAVGATFVIFDYGIDGYALGVLATEWDAASGAQQVELVQRADTAIWLLNGTFRSEIFIFYGLTVLLAGLGIAFDRRYPTWFGGIGALAGAAVAVVALSSFSGTSLTPIEGEDFFLFVTVLPVESAWLLALGVLMWRRASREAATAMP